MWYEERAVKSRSAVAPTFSLCCMKGKVELPLLHPPLQLLQNLLCREDSRGKQFWQHIPAYNMMFSFTSLGGRTETITDGPGPPVFRIYGQNYHRIGSLLPPKGSVPKFLQLYIYDTSNEECNRLNAFSSNVSDESLVADLKCMIDTFNPLSKIYRMARDRFAMYPDANVKLKLFGTRNRDQRRYNMPSTCEVAALIVDEVGGEGTPRDIVIETQTNRLSRISELHPSYLALQYPLLFPYGEDSYTRDIRYSDSSQGIVRKRGVVTMREYFAFRIQERIAEQSIILRSGRLFQQFVGDGYSILESSRLSYIRANQKRLRMETYQNLNSSVSDGNTSGASLGKRICLPSSFTGGARYMIQNYHDAMTIYKTHGHPDLFITFTCNSNWPEISRLVSHRALNAEDRPDIVDRIFEIKLQNMISEFRKHNIFGNVVALIYTIELQKRGLPHAHIVLFLHPDNKLSTADDIDRIITAELPDPLAEPELFAVVRDRMMHGPCGTAKPNSPCMKAGKCGKFFPKKYVSSTHFDSDGFPHYRRRDDGIAMEKIWEECDGNKECCLQRSSTKHMILPYLYELSDFTCVGYCFCSHT